MPITIKPSEKMQHSQDALSVIFAGGGEHLLSPCLERKGLGGQRR